MNLLEVADGPAVSFGPDYAGHGARCVADADLAKKSVITFARADVRCVAPTDEILVRLRG